jgi:hypothetical protein
VIVSQPEFFLCRGAVVYGRLSRRRAVSTWTAVILHRDGPARFKQTILSYPSPFVDRRWRVAYAHGLTNSAIAMKATITRAVLAMST